MNNNEKVIYTQKVVLFGVVYSRNLVTTIPTKIENL
jgi:hypothetical protein